MSSTGQARRRYNADGRRAQARATRERILETARTLFVEQGYAGTSIAQIAAAAGVSTPTVFAGFRSKVNLLKEATETTLVGDAEPVPLAERPQMRHVHAGGTAREVLERLAALIAEAAPRVCPMFAVVLAAADADPEIAELARTLDRHRLTGAAQLAGTVGRRLGDARPGPVGRDPGHHLDHELTAAVRPAGGAARLVAGALRGWIARALVALVAP